MRAGCRAWRSARHSDWTPAGSTGPGRQPQPELLDPRPAIEWRCRPNHPSVPPRELREHVPCARMS